MEFQEALQGWLARSQEIVTKKHAENRWSEIPTLKAQEGGRKYVRIISCQKGEESGYAFAFIERATGHVLKAASWKTPAKHARGIIYEVGREGVTAYGAEHLR